MQSAFFKTRFQEFSFLAITLLAFLTFYAETDIYTPSFPAMVTYFNTCEENIQLLLSMNFLGLLSSLIFGPISDAYGRKKALCSGLFIFMVGSIGCAFTDSLTWMIACRFIQGVGCGAIVSAGLATFFDVYPPEKSSRLVALLNAIVGGTMALAPMLGNWISIHMGWRMNFYLIAVLATLTFLCNLIFTKESLSLEKRAPLSLLGTLKNYVIIATNFAFMAHSLIWCIMFSVVMVFIANLSLIFIDHLQVSQENFGYYQTAIMGSYFIGSLTCSHLIKKYGMFTTKIIGNIAFLLGGLLLALFSLLNIVVPLFIILTIALVSLGSGLSLSIYFAYSMGYIDERLKGSALSLTQSLRLLTSAGLIGLASNYFDGTIKPVSMITMICIGVCSVLYLLLYKRKMHFVAVGD